LPETPGGKKVTPNPKPVSDQSGASLIRQLCAGQGKAAGDVSPHQPHRTVLTASGRVKPLIEKQAALDLKSVAGQRDAGLVGQLRPSQGQLSGDASPA
jgi:hypothetical protein